MLLMYPSTSTYILLLLDAYNYIVTWGIMNLAIQYYLDELITPLTGCFHGIVWPNVVFLL